MSDACPEPSRRASQTELRLIAKSFSAVGHELAGPLQTALNALFIIERKVVPTELVAPLHALEAALGTLRSRLDRLLALPEALHASREAASPRAVVELALARLGERAQVADAPAFDVDAAALELSELLHDALDAAPASQKIMNDLERRTIAEAVQGVLRHDARNKVGAIRNAAYFLRRKTEKTGLWGEPRIADFFALIDAQLTELEGVLGEGSAPSTAPSIAKLAECVKGALEAQPPAQAARVALELNEALLATIDAESLTLAVRALLDNALQASAPEGRVVISTLVEEGRPVIRVTDSGPGFPAERLAQAAAPLKPGWPGKAGLGLAVASRLVRLASGELRLRNAEAGGAIAELQLVAPNP